MPSKSVVSSAQPFMSWAPKIIYCIFDHRQQSQNVLFQAGTPRKKDFSYTFAFKKKYVQRFVHVLTIFPNRHELVYVLLFYS